MAGWTSEDSMFPKVTIAQVHGYCIGEGALISEACDITIVANDATLVMPSKDLAFAGSGVNLVPLFQMVGYKKARELVLTGRSMDGIEAERIGWATKTVPFEELEEETSKMAREICLLPKDGLAIGKASNHQILDILGLTKGWLQGYLTHTLLRIFVLSQQNITLLAKERTKG